MGKYFFNMQRLQREKVKTGGARRGGKEKEVGRVVAMTWHRNVCRTYTFFFLIYPFPVRGGDLPSPSFFVGRCKQKQKKNPEIGHKGSLSLKRWGGGSGKGEGRKG